MHLDYSKNIQFTNALFILVSYRVNIANAVERDSWVMCIYPDFSTDPGNSLVYTKESEYASYLFGESLTDIYDWICQEYSGMEITELALPASVS